MMKRLTQAAILFFVASAGSILISAQSSYSVPRAVDLDRIVRRSFPSFYVRAYRGGPMQQLYAEGFYPIGWSRDGKFAYYLEPVDEECGCYFSELVIMDLRTDKILYHYKNDWQTHVDEEGKPIPDDLQKHWNKNEKTFAEKLREHAVVQTPRFALLPATFSTSGRTYAAKMTKLKGNDSDGLRRIRKMDLVFSSPTLGRKSLYAIEYKGDDIWGSPLDSAVAGVFKSPFENRAAVVMINVQRGWEGPPHTVSVRIAGADLTSGFRR